MESGRLDNKWPGRSEFAPVLSPPRELLGFRGIFLVPTIFKRGADPETTLLLIQEPSVCDELEGKNLTELFLRPGVASTSWGPIFFLHFQIPDPATDGQGRITYECFVNTLEPNDVEMVQRLSFQTHWHLFLVDSTGTQRACLEFENNFLLGDAIDGMERILRSRPLRDFLKAKEECLREHSMDDLLATDPA